MSKLLARVKTIRNHQNLNIVEFYFMDTVLKMMSLDLNSEVEVGLKVDAIIKASDIIIGK